MSKIIKAEIYKLKHNLGFMILLILCVGIYGALNYMTESSADAVDAITQLAGFSFMIPVLASVAIASIVCDDYQMKTMKNVVSSGVSRSGIFFGKYITSMLVTLLLLVLDAIVSIVVCVYFKGFGDSSIAMGQLMENMALQVVIVLIFNTFSFIIASILKSSKSTIILSTILYLLDGAIFTGIGKLANIKMLGNYSLTAIETNVENFRMTSGDFMILALHLAAAIVLLLVALIKFKKEEIK